MSSIQTPPNLPPKLHKWFKNWATCCYIKPELFEYLDIREHRGIVINQQYYFRGHYSKDCHIAPSEFNIVIPRFFFTYNNQDCIAYTFLYCNENDYIACSFKDLYNKTQFEEYGRQYKAQKKEEKLGEKKKRKKTEKVDYYFIGEKTPVDLNLDSEIELDENLKIGDQIIVANPEDLEYACFNIYPDTNEVFDALIDADSITIIGIADESWDDWVCLCLNNNAKTCALVAQLHFEDNNFTKEKPSEPEPVEPEVSSQDNPNTEKEPNTMSATTTPDNKSLLGGFFNGTINRVKTGAKIGAAGEATLLCVETAEGILGRELPLPSFLGDNPALAELAREFVGLSVVKLAAGFVGGDKSTTALTIAQMAETDIGVRAMHMFGPVIRTKMTEFVERADAIVGDPSKTE